MAGARGYQNYRGRTPLWKKLLAVVLVLVILAAAVFLFLQKYLVYDDRGQVRLDLPWQQEETTPPSSGASSDEKGGETDLVIQEPERTQVRAVLLSGDSSGWAQQVTQAKAQGANAFAVTVKDSDGSLHYLSQTGQSVDTLSNDAQASDGAIRSLLTEEDVYAVARVSCFRDSLQARSAVEEMGLKNTGGYIFYDGNNENWLDPAKEAARTYLCEIIRSGIQSIDGGQTEAARSLGLSQRQNLRFIILPQAVKNILPAIANEFVVIIKESAITYTIGVQDIMGAVNNIRGATFLIMEPLLVATALYFCLCFPSSKIIAYFERRMSRGDRR